MRHWRNYWVFVLVLIVFALIPGSSGIGAQDSTAVPIPTETPILPTATPLPTNTPIPPTTTPVPSHTPLPPTDVPTATPLPTVTPIPPTATPLPTETPLIPTDTPVIPSLTPTYTNTPAEPPTPTWIPSPTLTPTIATPPAETPTSTPTPTLTLSGSETATFTPSPTQTEMATLTPTPTETSVSPSPTPLVIHAQAVQTYTVNSTADPGDGTCDITECTLREAITAANANTGFTDTIAFSIPGVGPHTIQPTSALPIITSPVIINGWTEPDFTGKPIIELDGSLAGVGVIGLEITAGNTTVRGLVINNYTDAGLRISINGNNVIEGNYIGTNVTGTQSRGNGMGILINNTPNDRIGGTSTSQRNVISGNNGIGIAILGTGDTNTTIQGNYIGLDATSTAALGNASHGIEIDGGNNNLIGGPDTDTYARNVIVDNGGRGISISSGSGTSIMNNYIGLNVSKVPFGNHDSGIGIASSANHHYLFKNRIAFNAGLGIDLNNDGVTPNDLRDVDTGANGLQNYPVINAAASNGSTVYIDFGFNSTPDTGHRIEWYVNDTCDPSGHGEGQSYIGNSYHHMFSQGNRDARDTVAFRTAVTPGKFLTAIGINLDTNDTSEYAACVEIAPITGPKTLTVNSTDYYGTGICDAVECTLWEALAEANVNWGFSDTIVFDIPGPGPYTIQPVDDQLCSFYYAAFDLGNTIVIDGTTQPGYSGSPIIDLDGSLLSRDFCGGIQHGIILGTNSILRGFVIRNFPGTGVRLYGSYSNVITGNYIGTDVTGTVGQGNLIGVEIRNGTEGSIIGGTTPTESNIISANNIGIDIYNSSNNIIQGNYIGTDITGTQNLGNIYNGIAILGTNTDPNPAINNQIGGTVPGAGNVIAFNGISSQSGAGISMETTDTGWISGNFILGNRIFSNYWQDIALNPVGFGNSNPDGVTPNDPGDADTGVNNLQNYPILSYAVIGGNSLYIIGTLNSTPNRTFRLEFFANDTCHSTGYGGGQDYLGFEDVTTNGIGYSTINVYLTASVATGQFITGTATDLTTNDTSEFSACVMANTGTPTPTPTGAYGYTVNTTADPGDGVCDATECTLREAISAANNHSGFADTIAFNIPGAGPHTIQPTSALPTITDPVIIDGWTEPDFAGSPVIEIDGSLAGANANGLWITAGNSTVRGLVINRFGGNGIVLEGSYNVIQSNYIGTDVTGTLNRGNSSDGIKISATATNNTIGSTQVGVGNVIAYNGGNGVDTTHVSGETSTANRIWGNRIHDNGALGIGYGDGPNLNDPSTEYNFPDIFDVQLAGNTLTISGRISGQANTLHRLEFFASDTCDLSHFGEGQTYLGFIEATTGSAQDEILNGIYDYTAILTANVSNGQVITATSTNLTNNSTSEFSYCVQVGGAATTFTVNTTDDSDDGVCDAVHCSLREALIWSTLNPGKDTIAFNIPGPGPHTIQPQTLLPIAFTPVIIDSWTEPDFAGTPVIEIDGAGTAFAGSSYAGGIQLNGGDSTVRGLVINNFYDVIDGPLSGIYTFMYGGNVIEGNYLGTDVTGTQAKGNDTGILIGLTQNDRIGGTTPASRNIISGNIFGGVVLFGPISTYTTVQGNYIGTDVTGSIPLGNGNYGIVMNTAHHNIIGGSEPGAANVIGDTTNDYGEEGYGILVGQAYGNTIIGNYIGTNAAGADLGNVSAGILMWGYDPQSHNLISQNRIAFNSGLGIDLSQNASPNGVTPNDPGDGDTGPNDYQNYPVLSTAEIGENGLTITGTLNSTASRSFRVEFFANDTCDPSGYGEGQVYLGFLDVATNASGDAAVNTNLAASVFAGQFITATATDLMTNDTSEFSACVEIVEGAGAQTYTVNTTADPGDGVCNITECTLREAIEAANANVGFTDTIAFNIPGSGPHTIQSTSALPTITDPVIIDGWTEPDFAGSPVIEIDGSLIGTPANGLWITAGSSTVRGLVINNFLFAGIAISNHNNNVVEGNVIGLDVNGTTAQGNRDGVYIYESTGNLIGGTTATSRNVIAGNTDDGVNLGTNANANIIQGNYLGADVTGTNGPGNSGDGIKISATANNNTIGGTQTGAGNLIAYNTGRGVYAEYIESPTTAGTGNLILRNSIHDNDALGIDFWDDGPTYNINRYTYGDFLPNHSQNFPDIFDVQLSGNTLTISGKLTGVPNTLHRLEFFVNDTCDASYFGEGQTYLGYTEVTTSDYPQNFDGIAEFVWVMDAEVSRGQFITATGTNLARNDTSEFSYCVEIGGAPTTFTVNTTDDTDDGVCDAAHCSLREALLWSTRNPGKDTIAFDIPGAGPHTIQPSPWLPIAFTPVIIDGWSEPDFAGTPIIEIDGSLMFGDTSGPDLAIAGGDSTVRGLVLNNAIQTAGLFLGKYGNNVVQGNYIGTDVTGTQARSNGSGISSDISQHDLIGGITPAQRNIISGNEDNIDILGPGNIGTIIQGNYIGVDVTGTVVIPGSFTGIRSAGDHIVIGGTEPGAGNIFGGSGIGLYVFGSGDTITGNYIGTNPSGADLGNTQTGLVVGDGATGHLITQNIVAFNGGLGIDLIAPAMYAPDGVTPNDPGDGDMGGNNLQNYPVLSTAETGGGSIAIVGTFNSTASRSFRLEFFANNTCDPSGYGQGQNYLGFLDVATNASGDATVNANLTATVSVGQFITATATDLTTNDTSEFSACVEATFIPTAPQTYTVNSTADPGDGTCNAAECTLREAIDAANANTGFTDTIAFNIPGVGPHTIQPIEQGRTYPCSAYTTTDPIIIDGSTQPGYSGTPLIEIDGSLFSPSVCDFYGNGIDTFTGNNTIRGLVIRNFSGIAISLCGGTGNTLVGNYIGTDVTGTIGQGNQEGVCIFEDSIIGGTTPTERNLISANGIGIRVQGDGNIIQGNYIGTDITGTQNLGNIHIGIAMVSGAIDPEHVNNNLIGGTSPGEGNIIAFNGMSFTEPGLLDGPGISVGGGGAAVSNSILGNRIFSNYWLGITLNDPGYADAGGNNLQNYPILTNAAADSNTITISGTFNSTASRSFRLEFFANDTCDPTGYGEGQYYLGFLNVTTNASGDAAVNANLAATVSAGQFITATATDLTTNDTSEFSACVEATGFTDLAITKTDTPDPVLAGANLTYTLTITNQGGQTATGVELTDALPAGVTFVSADVTQGVGSCAENTGVVTCVLEDMLPSDTASVSIVAMVDVTTTGQITNTATITSIESDNDPSDNTAAATTTITAPPLPGRVTLVSPRSGTQTNDATPELTWNAATNATQYQIQVDNDARFRSPEVDALTDQTTFTPSDSLVDGRWYWRVRPLNPALQTGTWTSAWWLVVDTIAPDTPILTQPVDANVTYLALPTFRWRAVGGANLYRLQVADTSDFSHIVVDVETNRTALRAPVALPQGTYYWQVAARDTAGNWGSFSAPFTFAVNLQRSPADGSATRDTTPAFTWASYPGAINYQLEVATDTAFTQPVSGFPLNTTRTSYTVPVANALPYGTYYWRVNVDTGSGTITSPFFFTVAVTNVLPIAPVQVSPRSGTQLNNATPELTWNATRSTGNEPYTYEVQIDDDSRFHSPQQTAIVSDLAYTIDPLADGRWYWRVRTIDQYGAASGWSRAWNFILDTVVPDAPDLIAPADGSLTYLALPTFRWRGVTNANLYRLQVADTGGFSHMILDMETNRTSLRIPDALPQGTYYWQVAARDTAGNWGSFSTPFTFAVNIQRSPADGSATRDTTPVFVWAGYPGAVNYQLEVATDTAFTQPVSGFPVNTTRTSYTVPAANALPYGTYYWRVNVDTGAGVVTSPFFFTVAVTPVLPIAPVQISPRSGTQLNTATPELTWNATRSTGNEPYTYEVQIDDDSRFRSPAQVAVLNDLSLTADPLTDGRWYWRVRTIDQYGAAGGWSRTWNFTVDTITPDTPVLTLPANQSVTYLALPTFRWRAVRGVNLYRLQIADTSDFSHIVVDVETSRTALRAPAALPQGTYYWQVAARDTAGNWGSFSEPFTFDINIQRRPIDGSATRDTTPAFTWASYPGAINYQLEFAADAEFTQPLSGFAVDTTRTSYTVPAADALPYGTYYWRVSVDTGSGLVTSPFHFRLAVTQVIPVPPALIAPGNGVQIANQQPLFTWQVSRTVNNGPLTYEIEIDDDSRFRSVDVRGATATTSFMPPSPLADGRWYWRVRTVNKHGAAGNWSRAWNFTLDAPTP
ncbi:MAG: CSLREA domain-containing protein [Anaerolineaceae bacterium]|nr:CSLREA domain-containing protein [Anaerolineaceae bacterium]